MGQQQQIIYLEIYLAIYKSIAMQKKCRISKEELMMMMIIWKRCQTDLFWNCYQLDTKKISTMMKRLGQHYFMKTNLLFLFYNFKFNTYWTHDIWTKRIISFSYEVIDEAKKNRRIEKIIQKLLKKADVTYSPMVSKLYTEKDFIWFVIVIDKEENKTGINII